MNKKIAKLLKFAERVPSLENVLSFSFNFINKYVLIKGFDVIVIPPCS